MKFNSAEKKSMFGMIVIMIIFIFSIFIIGKRNLWFEQKNNYITFIEDADSLGIGNIVTLSGLRVGEITNLEVQKDTNLIKVVFTVKSSLAFKIREDSKARFYRTFLIGGKRIDIIPGNIDLPAIPNNGELKAVGSKEITDLLSGKNIGLFLNKLDGISSGLENFAVEIGSFTKKIKADDLTKTYNLINPALTNLNKLTLDLNVFIDVLKYMKKDLLKNKLAKTTMGNLNTILRPIAKRKVLLTQILDNLQVLSKELRDNPQLAKDMTKALNEVITTLKAIQKTWFLKSHVEDLKKNKK